MKKSEIQTKRRSELVRKVMNDRDEAADILEDYADKIRTTRSTVGRVRILSELMCISESTIYRDISAL